MTSETINRRREEFPTLASGILLLSHRLGPVPLAAREVRVHLHPEDAAVVRQHLAPTESERAWAIVEDPTLSRGGCMVRTENSQIDVRLDSRINAIIANALGEERAPERPTPDPGQIEE